MKTILVIDDSLEDRYFTGRALRKAEPELNVHEFDYAEDALEFLRSPQRPLIDLVLVDINMPRMDGFEFADAYQDLYPELRGNAPVYILSSSLNPADQTKAFDHSAVAGFVEKPVTNGALVSVLEQLSRAQPH